MIYVHIKLVRVRYAHGSRPLNWLRGPAVRLSSPRANPHIWTGVLLPVGDHCAPFVERFLEITSRRHLATLIAASGKRRMVASEADAI